MPFTSTVLSERPAQTLSHWWLGPVSIRADSENRISVVTSVRRGDETGPSYHPDDQMDLRSADLAAEFAGDMEALALIVLINSQLETIAQKLMDIRGMR